MNVIELVTTWGSVINNGLKYLLFTEKKELSISKEKEQTIK